jgi:hypothetical protein
LGTSLVPDIIESRTTTTSNFSRYSNNNDDNTTTAKMPGEVIDRPNPQPLPSQIPDNVLELSVKLEKIAISESDLRGLEEFRRASNYIAAGG